MTLFHSAARAAAALACATMIASPALAAGRTKPRPSVPITLPLSAKPEAPAWSGDASADYRRWRRHHRGGIDGGDVLGGLLIIGAVAAAAAAIDKDKEERRRDRTQGRDYPYPQRPYDYRDRDTAYDRDNDRAGRGDPREADRAVDACTAEAARSGRVDEIFDVEKVGGEWRVEGDYATGRGFTCSVDATGRAYVGSDRGAEADPRPEIGADEDDLYADSGVADFEDARGR